MSRFSGMYDVRVNQYVTVSLLFVVGVVLAVILTDDALSAFKPFKYINAKIESETIGSVRLADLDPPPLPIPLSSFVWCFKEAPAFSFVRGQKVMTMTFGGSLQEIMSLDRPLSGGSLECSDDGAVVTVFSRDGSDFFIKNGTKLGHYKTTLSSPRGPVQNRHILSPSGMIIAAPFNFTFASGDDVLSNMRVLTIDGDHFSWRNDEILYVDHTALSVQSYNTNTDQLSTLVKIGELYMGKKYRININKIATCNKTSLVSLSWPTADSAQFTSVIINMNPTFEVTTITGPTSSVVANGRLNSACIITRATMIGELEVTKYELLFGDGLVKYALPREVDFGYEVAVAPRNCLVLGRHYLFGKDGVVVDNETSIVAIRITRSGRCRG